jgi:hypothetical protein
MSTAQLKPQTHIENLLGLNDVAGATLPQEDFPSYRFAMPSRGSP